MREMADVILTKRLALTALTVHDAEALHPLFADPGHLIGDGPLTDPADTLRWLERRESLRSQTGLTWYGVRLRGESELIGNAGLFVGRTGDEPEIGYEIGSGHRRQGYANEAVDGVLAEARRLGLVVWATVRPWNAASVAVLARLGFVSVEQKADERGPLAYFRHFSASDT